MLDVASPGGNCDGFAVNAEIKLSEDILPKFPAVTRDIAVVCDKLIPVAALSKCIMKSGGKFLKACNLFDIYTGEHVADGKKSVAFSLTMRADDQTLTDEHAEETVKSVLDALESKFGATIR